MLKDKICRKVFFSTKPFSQKKKEGEAKSLCNVGGHFHMEKCRRDGGKFCDNIFGPLCVCMCVRLSLCFFRILSC